MTELEEPTGLKETAELAERTKPKHQMNVKNWHLANLTELAEPTQQEVPAE